MVSLSASKGLTIQPVAPAWRAHKDENRSRSENAEYQLLPSRYSLRLRPRFVLHQLSPDPLIAPFMQEWGGSVQVALQGLGMTRISASTNGDGQFVANQTTQSLKRGRTMLETKFNPVALVLAVAATMVVPLAQANSAPPSAPLAEVKGVAIDDFFAKPSMDWRAISAASITVSADIEDDRNQYNLDEREIDRLITDYEKELAQALERRAGLSIVAHDAGVAQIHVTITDVDVALPKSARYSVRSASFSRWNGSLAIEGTVTAPDGQTVVASFSDDVTDSDAFIQRQSTISVTADMARLADRSASRIASAFRKLTQR